MLEVDNVMRFDFLFWKIIIVGAMVNEFPQAFGFILVNNWNSHTIRLFYLWSLLIVFEIFILLCWNYLFLLFLIQKCWVICVWWKVYITIWTSMVKLKAIVKVNFVSLMLISSMRTYLEKNLGRKLRSKLQLKGTFSNIGCL